LEEQFIIITFSLNVSNALYLINVTEQLQLPLLPFHGIGDNTTG